MAIPITPINPLDAQSQFTPPQDAIQPQAQKPVQETPVDPKRKKINDEIRTQRDICRTYRRKLLQNWTTNIDYRRGKPFSSHRDDDQIAVNLDWTMTKTKQAALFSQVPEVRIKNPMASQFEKKLNDRLRKAGIETAMDECLPDCINAAGLGAVLVSYEAITEDRSASIKKETLVEGQEPEMTTIPVPLDVRYLTERISPADFLWPTSFTGSNFDNAPWVGRSGRISWAQAVNRFSLPEEDRETILGEDRSVLDRLTHDVEKDRADSDRMVGFDEIFYKEFQFDQDAKSYSTIRHLVFVAGKTKPVIDELWKGQKTGENGQVIGAQKYPLRVLTLAYISDETIPPSDTAIGRPQVDEINKARTQMIKQRERSLPVRWADVNRVDPSIMQSMIRGTWQSFIPVQGPGDKVIGEVARASMPVENFKFHAIAMGDLRDEWTIGPTPLQVEEMENDPDQNKSSFNSPAGRERAKVASFLCGIAEVLGGLMCIYDDPADFGEGFDPILSKYLECSILADSTVLLDASQKLSRLNQFVNTYGKSGWVDLEPLLKEAAILSGVDPSVVRAPQPKPPVEPNISLRLTGVQDLLNPLALALLIKSGQAPPPELIEQAKQLIQQAVVPPQLPGDQGPMDPNNPEGGQGLPPGLPPGVGGPLPAPQQGPPPGGPTPSPSPHPVGEAHPQWTTMPKLDKRSDSKQG
jgi:hypothetical protein